MVSPPLLLSSTLTSTKLNKFVSLIHGFSKSGNYVCHVKNGPLTTASGRIIVEDDAKSSEPLYLVLSELSDGFDFHCKTKTALVLSSRDYDGEHSFIARCGNYKYDTANTLEIDDTVCFLLMAPGDYKLKSGAESIASIANITVKKPSETDELANKAISIEQGKELNFTGTNAILPAQPVAYRITSPTTVTVTLQRSTSNKDTGC